MNYSLKKAVLFMLMIGSASTVLAGTQYSEICGNLKKIAKIAGPRYEPPKKELGLFDYGIFYSSPYHKNSKDAFTPVAEICVVTAEGGLAAGFISFDEKILTGEKLASELKDADQICLDYAMKKND